MKKTDIFGLFRSEFVKQTALLTVYESMCVVGHKGFFLSATTSEAGDLKPDKKKKSLIC